MGQTELLDGYPPREDRVRKPRRYAMVGEETKRQRQERLEREAEEREAKRDLDRRRERYMRCSLVVGAVLGLGVGAAMVFGGEADVRWGDAVMGMLMCLLFVGGFAVILLMMAWFLTHPNDTDNEYYRNTSSGGGMGPRMLRWYTRGYVRRSMRRMFR